eukprot:GHVO01034088.1.p1 GENE.GHVO01034088.1~~GHVO01034088.1.p1  ORF type:complete len:164 (-),score=34.68 GHVO01034088.1:174-665(-)
MAADWYQEPEHMTGEESKYHEKEQQDFNQYMNDAKTNLAPVKVDASIRAAEESRLLRNDVEESAMEARALGGVDELLIQQRRFYATKQVENLKDVRLNDDARALYDRMRHFLSEKSQREIDEGEDSPKPNGGIEDVDKNHKRYQRLDEDKVHALEIEEEVEVF